MRRAILLLFAALAMAPRARAEDCGAASDQATMNACAGAAWKKSDSVLNELYAQLRRRLAGDAHGLGRLTNTQRAWVAYRDAECDFSSAGVDGGSVSPMIHLMCADGLTRQRIADFQRYLHCQEGDLSCPVPPQ